MSMIPEDIVEQVRDSADLVSIIGESVDLKRTGSDYRGPCPFHGGTHRNFSVVPKKGRYYCFVCNESGDVFTWMMKRLGMDYPSAVREVARKVGIVIPESAARTGPDPLEPLFGAMAVAQDWFTRQLVESSEASVAREYLQGRDLPIDTAVVHGLGFAPPGRLFLAAMAELGLEQQVLVEAGLVAVRDDGSVAPRFRGRLLFPIHDLRGRVVGFGGRLLGPGEPKYLNSPENPIFHKGRQLYNLHLAKGAIRKAESVIIVEGYFDVLRLTLAGVENVVAPLGTALTSDQASLLKRFAPAATLLYDSDKAGLRATFRAGDELLRHGIRVRVATLPSGEDPDTLVKAGGAAALEPILHDAMDLIERMIQLLELKGWFEGVDHQREALDRLLPTIRATSDSLMRELYLTRVAERSGVPREVLEKELATSPKYAAPARPPAAAPPPTRKARSAARTPSTEARLLQAIMLRPELSEQAAQQLSPELFERPIFREIFTALTRDPAGAGQLPAGLSEDGQRAWTLLKELAADVIGPSADDIFASSVQILVARPEYRKIHTLTDPGERQRRRALLRKQYPEADRWYEWKRLRRRKEA